MAGVVGAQGEIRIVPANEASWEDVQTVFGTRAAGSPRG